MDSSITMIVLLLLSVSMSLQVQGVHIIDGPINQTVFVTGNATFECSVSRNAIRTYWVVDGRFIHSDNTLRDVVDIDTTTIDGALLHTLVIPAHAVSNNSVILCVAYGVNDQDNVSSDGATLTKQGVLAPVGDVIVENGCNSIRLSWSPPFSLDVTGEDLDIWYTVLISNVIENSTDRCDNIPQPQFNFTTANPNPYHKYNFTVIPQNEAGEGEWSEPTEGAFKLKCYNSPHTVTKSHAVSTSTPYPVPTNKPPNTLDPDSNLGLVLGLVIGLGTPALLIGTVAVVVALSIWIKRLRSRQERGQQGEDEFNEKNVLKLLKKEEDMDWEKFGQLILVIDYKDDFLNQLITYEKLVKIVKKWITRDKEASWKKLALTLTKLGHDTLAEEAIQKHRRSAPQDTVPTFQLVNAPILNVHVPDDTATYSTPKEEIHQADGECTIPLANNGPELESTHSHRIPPMMTVTRESTTVPESSEAMPKKKNMPTTVPGESVSIQMELDDPQPYDKQVIKKPQDATS